MEKYLIDSNSFITPYNNYYAFDLTPSYWSKLAPILTSSDVAVLDLVRNEIIAGNDSLTNWFNQQTGVNVENHSDRLITAKYGEVINYLSNSPLYNNDALRKWSISTVADPWLIATASAKNYTIITFETHAGTIDPNHPSSKPKIPDVARQFGVKCESLFYFMRQKGIAL